ncbi:MAG: GTP 3',8-cyclase MoaA [Deltaproteobacteria bacterium]|nr:GTP 3',8-cyclase MoaA [Deltaproteobacteria bacterium]
MLIDAYHRKIEYLRLSVTDLCNLRCRYCMPEDGVHTKSKSEILSFEEITRMVRILVALGVKRVRLTGGEPLVRKNLPRLIAMLQGIAGLEEILLTTNGVLLETLAYELKQAGLNKINIHLDTLHPEKFRHVTRWGDLEKVLRGLEKAIALGFKPIKLNMVVQRGFNDEEVEDLLHFAKNLNLVLRLIELMPIGPAQFQQDAYLPLGQILARLSKKYTLEPYENKLGFGPAQYYFVKDFGVVLGTIRPVSKPFCDGCDRIRLSCDGRVQDCLAYNGVLSVRDILRGEEKDDETLAHKIVNLIQGKREGHLGFMQSAKERVPCMYGIGG